MAKITSEYEKYILSSIKDIDYGSVVITLHAGKVAQVEITEKIRVESNNGKR
ncbi:YezD family protein [Cytobacillus firmus]|uniref:YezD family protein n=1 Tax=Cytobacillus firmus TaxID=1399 RepID=UPI0021620E3D|nr:YezD family protein [Cytobacillus firmus]MCS0670319.1 YezD family protein [Cytobacillus firmus]